MKKTLIAFAALCAASVASAEDSTLYWMVNNPTDYKDHSAIAFEYAKVSIDGGSTYLKMYDSSGNATEWESAQAYDNQVPGALSGMFDSDSHPTFLVELYNDSDVRVGWQTYTYEQVRSGIAGGTGQTGRTPFEVTGDIIPEPSCGLLALVGLAAMALRRRRA